MPAEEFTKKADTPKRKRQWQHVYDSVLAAGGSPKQAVIRASGVVKKSSRKAKTKKSRGKKKR